MLLALFSHVGLPMQLAVFSYYYLTSARVWGWLPFDRVARRWGAIVETASGSLEVAVEVVDLLLQEPLLSSPAVTPQRMQAI